jgi:DNA-directed RNA polymerase subunit P|nr:putative DNA directed RNA polymerase, 7 kDa subunit [uncultured marine crenarchaeote HF4000_ANIW141M12]
MDLECDVMVDESNVETNDDGSADNVIETEKFDVIYSCLRCNTKVSSSELNRLPEIKCICGFRVFTKVRPPIVKTVKAI